VALPARGPTPVPAARPRPKSAALLPWIGFPVAYALSGIMLTVFGYVAMILAQ